MTVKSLRIAMSQAVSTSSSFLLFLLAGGLNVLAAKILPIADLDDPVNLTKRTLSNPFLFVADKPLTGVGFTGCLSHWFAIQANFLDARALLDHSVAEPDTLSCIYYVTASAR